ncbi:MAG: murein L,D-transpeptidase [Rhodospirillales bacterium]|nr:murein L,D-transpeptidase [Rhodospirillales bacterium]
MRFKIHSILWIIAILAYTGPVRAEKIDALRSTVQPELEKELAAHDLKLGQPIFIRVFKQEKIAEVWVQETGKKTYNIFKRYPICVFSGTLGPKLRQGDNQAPEGFYDVTAERLHPDSKYHLAFNLGYPNSFDRMRGRTGDFLMIHGGCTSQGCYAMTDQGMEELYILAEAALANGQKKIEVHLFPFIMTRKNLVFHGRSTWMPFWKSLKPAYDLFQKTRIPPKISVQDGRYRVDLP